MLNMISISVPGLDGQTREGCIFAVQCRPDVLALWTSAILRGRYSAIFGMKERGHDLVRRAWMSFDGVATGDNYFFLLAPFLTLAQMALGRNGRFTHHGHAGTPLPSAWATRIDASLATSGASFCW